MLRDKKAIQELKEIVLRDYGATISDDQAEELGVSLLRLTRVALSTLTRTNAKSAFVGAREEISLGAKTST